MVNSNTDETLPTMMDMTEDGKDDDTIPTIDIGDYVITNGSDDDDDSFGMIYPSLR